MSKINDNILGLSKNEVAIISDLEFRKQYFFSKNDISKYFDNVNRMYYFIHRLLEKKRIIKLSKDKYYLIPIKSRTGFWSENPYIIADEMMDSKDYYIGGWAAAYFWRLTDQIPMKYEIYTNKRSGKIEILNEHFIFRKTTKDRLDNSVVVDILGHNVKILEKGKIERWIQLRS
ncbi:MAG: hypothetical protein PHT94_04070 [Candidatus Nanoarchaeia archaeon]|nr:hypothetical protein [Candidatus Nanoarchaeia archaeon]